MANASATELLSTIPCRNQLGEGIHWDVQRQVFRWCDIEGQQLHHYDPQADSLQIWTLDTRITYATSVSNDERLLAVLANGLAWLDLDANKLDWIQRIRFPQPDMRLNDARVDRQQRLWIGSMHEKPTRAPAGTLYCLNRGLELTQHKQQLTIANGISWSIDSSVIYLADSPHGVILRAQFDPALGVCHDWTEWHQVRNGSPDGATLDSENRLWSCVWGASTIVRLGSDGQITERITLPVSQASCPAFGGRDLKLLALTSARAGLSADELRQQPEAGNVLIFRTPWRGVEEPCFQPG